MQTIDLRGFGCPTNFIKATLALEMMDSGETVKFLLDAGEPARNIPRSLKAEGHRVLWTETRYGYHVLTLKKALLDGRYREPVREYPSIMITRSGRAPATDPVMMEETVELIVNGARLASIVTTPGMHKELAVGYLVTEGVVSDRNDIEKISANGNRVYLEIRSFDNFDHWHELRSSGCIGLNWEKRKDDLHVPLEQVFAIDILLDSIEFLYDETQQSTGGAHTASLVDADGGLRYKALDIGRHNAVDKVVGMALLSGDDLSKMFLVSSGRQPAGMVMKAARAGIPLVISKSAPVSSGIDSAIRSNVTLCCFATAEKVKVFSVPERIAAT
ncbi:MAG TPA: formate dehydrogenase accessory sulfurtransferase FdhD [Geobacteraceae bacterium]|nr:formate dehydrogenase accessory sulfurtransferase FdhD [Geobacteraceae bacterium]